MSGAAIRKQDVSGRGIRVIALRAGEPIGEWEVRKETVTFGRSVTADVALQDNKKLSRIHCSFELRADGVWVRDAGSANGVWLHDRRVTEALLVPGDHVVAAGIRLSAVAVAVGASAAAEAPVSEERTPTEEEEEKAVQQPTLRLLPAFDPRSVIVSPATSYVEPLPPAIAAALIPPFTIAAPAPVAVPVPVPAPTPVSAVVLSAAPGPFVDELADQIAHLPRFTPAREDAVAAPAAPFALTIGGRRHARGVRGPRTMLWIAVSAITLVVGGATLAALLT